MKPATKATVVAVMLFFVSLWVVAAAGAAAVWLTSELRVFGLVLLPTGIVASLLILYFDWRARMRRQILAERDEPRKAA